MVLFYAVIITRVWVKNASSAKLHRGKDHTNSRIADVQVSFADGRGGITPTRPRGPGFTVLSASSPPPHPTQPAPDAELKPLLLQPLPIDARLSPELADPCSEPLSDHWETTEVSSRAVSFTGDLQSPPGPATPREAPGADLKAPRGIWPNRALGHYALPGSGNASSRKGNRDDGHSSPWGRAQLASPLSMVTVGESRPLPEPHDWLCVCKRGGWLTPFMFLLDSSHQSSRAVYSSFLIQGGIYEFPSQLRHLRI